MVCLCRPFFLVVAAIAAAYLLVNQLCPLTCSPTTASTAVGFESGTDDLPYTYLYVAIYTAPLDVRLRQTIRNTWLTMSSLGVEAVRHHFPIGTKSMAPEQRAALERENEEYGDLVFLPAVHEGYDSLTMKTLHVMKNAVETTHFKYLLKVDSDSYVRLSVLVKSLRDISHPYLYWGFLDGRAPVHRRGKWMEKDWHLCDRYLPYATGGGYVLAYQLVKFIASNSALLKIYISEDVSVGAWLAGTKAQYVHDPRFDTEWTSRGCSNEYLITHKQTESDLEQKARSLRLTGKLCGLEQRVRGSYVYDWTVPPSKCCVRVNNTNIP